MAAQIPGTDLYTSGTRTQRAPRTEGYQENNVVRGTNLPANMRAPEIANPAAGLKELGQGIDELGSAQTRLTVQRQQAQQDLWMLQQNSADELQAQKLLQEHAHNVEPGKGISEAVTSDWNNYASVQLDGVQDPVLKAKYAENQTRVHAAMMAKAQVFDQQEADRYAMTNFTQSVDNSATFYQGIDDYQEIDNKLQYDVGKYAGTLKNLPLMPEQKQKMIDDMRKNLTDAANMQKYTLDPRRFLNENVPSSAFDAAVNWVMQKEGGFVSNDGGRGPTKYGINSEANPDVNLAALTPESAKQLYHDRYWLAIGADKLPPAMALIAFDGAVNQGVKATKDLLRKAGGDPNKLLDLREELYRKTAEKNPAQAANLDGWLNRLNALAQQAQGFAPHPAAKVFSSPTGGTPDNTPGMVTAGNIDLTQRPVVKNGDGSISTVRSASFNIDGKEVLLPTVSQDGKLLSNDEAITLYRRTGNNLGTFESPEAATAYAQQLHLAQAAQYATDGNQLQIVGSPSYRLGTFEQQQNWVQKAHMQLSKNEAETAKQKAAYNAAYNSDFEIALNRGQKSYADIEQAYQSGLISPEQRQQYTTKLDEYNHLTLKDKEGAQRVNLALGGTGFLDPKNADDKKAVDNHYKAWLDAVQNQAAISGAPVDAATLQSKQIELVNRYGMIPTTLQGALRGQLRSGSADQKAAAADMIDKLRVKNPELLNDFADEDIKAAINLNSLVSAGYSPDKAVQRIADQLKVTPEIKKNRDEQFTAALKANKPEDIIRSQLTSWLPSWLPFTGPEAANPRTIPPEMQADFTTLARDEFLRTGNFDAASKSSLQQLQKTWGPSAVGVGNPKSSGIGTEADTGMRWMKFAPEKFYGAGTPDVNNSEWMNEQLLDEVKPFAQKEWGSVSKDNVALSPAFVKTPQGGPAYYVNVLDKNGVLQPVNKTNGDPLIWWPDWKSSKEIDRLIERDKARAQRVKDAPSYIKGKIG